MDIINIYIAAKENPTNWEAQQAAQTAVLTRADEYFAWVKGYLWSQELDADIVSGAEYSYEEVWGPVKLSIENRQENRTRIQTEFDSITAQFQDRKSKLEFQFQASARFDPISWMEIFYFLSSISSLSPLEKIVGSSYRTAICAVLGGFFNSEFAAYLYPLPNREGFFSVSEYLQAAFHGILIVGVPLRPCRFDQDFGCPLQFITHDVAHASRIWEDYILCQPSIFPDLTRAYDKLLLEPNPIHREALMFYLWALIHEIGWNSDWNNRKPLSEYTSSDLQIPAETATAFEPMIENWKSIFPLLPEISMLESYQIWAKSELELRCPWL